MTYKLEFKTSALREQLKKTASATGAAPRRIGTAKRHAGLLQNKIARSRL
jgi:hypothetical protein